MDGNRRYAAGSLLLQASLLTACDSQPEAATPAKTSASAMNDTARSTVAAPAGPQRLILAFGDSLYAGYGLGRGQSLADAVQARLRTAGINATVVNAGVSGDTTAAGRRRLTFSLDNLPRKPDLVLLGLGGNDVLRQLPAAETRANMKAMLETLHARGIPVLLTGMQAPPNLGPEYVGAFDSVWPDLAKTYDAALYPFILDGVIGQRSMMQGDYVHPNAAGVNRIADRLTPLVAATLEKAG